MNRQEIKILAYKLLYAAFGLLPILEYSLAQESCDPKVAEMLEANAGNDIFVNHWNKRQLPYDYSSQYYTFKSLDLELLSKDETELDLLENAFKTKMQIIKHSRDVSDIIEEQKNKLLAYIKARREVLDSSPSPIPDYVQLPWLEDDEIGWMLANCKPCIDINTFKSCLQKRVDPYIKEYQEDLDYYKGKEKAFKQFDNINSKDFLSNATKKLMEIFKSYNQDITVQQVKDHYIYKLIALNKQIVEAQESPENSVKTYITFTGYILRKSFQYVKYSMQFYDQSLIYKCKGLEKLDKILESFDKIYSPYVRLAVVDVEGFAARYAKPIQNITDIDALLYVLETAIMVGRKEAYPNPPKLLTQLGADIYSMLTDISSYYCDMSNLVGQETKELLNCIVFAFNGCTFPTCNDFLLKNTGDRPAGIQKCYYK